MSASQVKRVEISGGGVHVLTVKLTLVVKFCTSGHLTSPSMLKSMSVAILINSSSLAYTILYW